MKYAAQMVSRPMMFIPSFIKIGSGIRKTNRQHGDRISLLLFFFFQNKESRLKVKVGLWDHFAVCVSPLSTFKCLEQSLWNLVCISWHLSTSQRRASVCVYICIPHIVASQRLGKHVPAATITRNNRRIVELVLYAVRVITKESRRLVFPRYSCFIYSPFPSNIPPFSLSLTFTPLFQSACLYFCSIGLCVTYQYALLKQISLRICY
jgi:hypothetical protein